MTQFMGGSDPALASPSGQGRRCQVTLEGVDPGCTHGNAAFAGAEWI